MAKKDIGIDLDFNGNSLLQKGEESIAASVIITPPIITVNQNNYNPTSLQLASILRLSSSAPMNITGITAPDTIRNKQLIIINTDSNNITLKDASALSLAANRFDINGDVILNGKEAITLLYDQITLRWVATGRAN